LARGIILVAALGSIVLFFVNRRDRAKLEFLQESLQSTVPATVENIQRLSQQYSKLVGLQEAEGLKRTASPEKYFDRMATLPGSNMGFLVYTPSNSTYDRGIEDAKYRIKPSEKDAEFTRDQIAYFMWQLEANSNRLKLTDIDIQLADRKGLKDHDIPEDTWTFSIETTTRQEEVE
jgi:hypothetical protein